jgi:glycosyltransferase involved in cell wall biosynthesis
LGIGLDEPLILAIGRLEPQKGLLHLLDAASVVATKHPRAIIAIAGKEGRSSDQLRAKAAESPLTVQFLGHRTDVPTLLAGADVFCFPSEREGLGGVLVEALAVGCPVVASSIPTSLEVLAANGPPVGLLAPVGDAGSLGDLIVEVLESPTISACRAKAGREHFEREYTIDVVVEQMIDFFERARAE